MTNAARGGWAASAVWMVGVCYVIATLGVMTG